MDTSAVSEFHDSYDLWLERIARLQPVVDPAKEPDYEPNYLLADLQFRPDHYTSHPDAQVKALAALALVSELWGKWIACARLRTRLHELGEYSPMVARYREARERFAAEEAE